ncbi:Grap2 and cyclin-D-interacting-domain-containing protein, partial [Cunninghamella echinulata]
KLEDKNSLESATFDEKKLQDTMQKLCTILSHDATKLTLACKPPRKPQDAIKMVDEMNNTLYRIIGFYYDIPVTNIQTYRKAYKNMVDQLIRGAISLLSSFMDEKRQREPLPFMLSTAALWEVCKASCQLPIDNKQAILIEWKALLDQLKDVKNETEDMIDENIQDNKEENDDYDNDDFETSVDGIIGKKCGLLVSLTQLLFQKIQKRCSLSDTLLDQGQLITEEVDIMVSKAYDLERDEMITVMKTFASKVSRLIEIAALNSDRENESWFKVKIYIFV